ncbi:MAG: hypothetical protein KF709_07880 [Gemmatimonadaceae bacterium]|nr:hypothetical protein [Gemmatimonadaceae bacterium]
MSEQPAKSLKHTLNNPLGAILAELQLLEMEDLTPAQREGIERAIAQVRRLVGLIREHVPDDA